MSPPISVLLPFYNAAATVGETLRSLQAQSWEEFEVVVVDDGSTDGGAEVVRRFARDDARIRLLQPGRLGVVEATNYGIHACRAPLVARIDADDRMRPGRLAAQFAYFKRHPECDLVGTQVHLFPEDEIQAGFRTYIEWQNGCISPESLAHDLYVELPIAQPSWMFRREKVLELGGYRDGPFPEDYELLLRLHHSGGRLGKVAEVLTDWRESTGRLTRTDPRYSREAFDRLRAEYLARDQRLDPARPLAFWGAGRKTRRRSRWLREKGFAPVSWIDIDPRKIGNRIDGVPVVDPQWLDRPERPFVLSYVTNHGARDIIADQLHGLGYRRGEDYLMVG